MEEYGTYIFDLYGTLIDSDGDEKSPQNWKKWLRVLDKKGIKHADYITFRKEFFDMDKALRLKSTLENGYEFPEIDVIDIYRFLFEKYGNGILSDELLYELSYDFRVATTKYIRLYDGVTDYLKMLREKGKKLYILSNAQRSYTWPEIKMFGLEILTDDQFISSDFGAMKPQISFYDALFTKYNIAKKDAVMVGDSIWSDINGAIAYGISYIHLEGDNDPYEFFRREIKNQED